MPNEHKTVQEVIENTLLGIESLDTSKFILSGPAAQALRNMQLHSIADKVKVNPQDFKGLDYIDAQTKLNYEISFAQYLLDISARNLEKQNKQS